MGCDSEFGVQGNRNATWMARHTSERERRHACHDERRTPWRSRSRPHCAGCGARFHTPWRSAEAGALTRNEFLETVVGDFTKVLELQKSRFDNLSVHSQGGLPGALASAPWLPERRDAEEGYLNRTSHAVMQGTALPVVAKLLGHSWATMTLRYAHTGDRETEAAKERIGGLTSELLGMSPID